MEKETRMSKYKELRDELKDDIMNNPSTSIEGDKDEDDFLSFLHNDDNEDTMVTPIEVTTSSKEEVDALMNKGQEHNTRMDIFNKIRQESNGVVEEQEDETPGSLLDKLAEMSPKEDVEALHEYQKEVEIQQRKEETTTRKEKKSKPKKEKKSFFKKKEKILEPIEVEDEEENDLVSKIINYVTIALAVIAVILFALVIKSIIFA